MSESREVHILSRTHAEGVRALSLEPDVAAAAALKIAMTAEDAREYVALAEKSQQEGRSYVFVLTDHGAVAGICRLIGLLGVPRLIVAVGHAWRGRGNGAFLVRHVLEFAFEALNLDRVTAGGPCLLLVSRYGRVDGNGLHRQDWQPVRH